VTVTPPAAVGPVRRLNYPKPVTDEATVRVALQHPVYGVVFREIPVKEDFPTPWMDPWFGLQMHVVGKENDGRTLVLQGKRLAASR